MSAPTFRIEWDVVNWPEMRRGGARARSVWLPILVLLAQRGGLLTDEDLDAEALAESWFGDAHLWSAGIEACKASGLLRSGEVRFAGGAGGARWEGGWSSPRFCRCNGLSFREKALPTVQGRLGALRGEAVMYGGYPSVVKGESGNVGGTSDYIGSSSSRSSTSRTPSSPSSTEESPRGGEAGRGGPVRPREPASLPADSQGPRLAAALREAIRKHTPRVAERYDGPGKLDAWARDLDKLVRIDKASPPEVEAVIRWAHQTDPRGFWRGNLLSGGKVRQHWDRLVIQARQGGAGKAVSASGASGGLRAWITEHHRWLLRQRDYAAAVKRPLTVEVLRATAAEEEIPLPAQVELLLEWLKTRP